MNLMLHFFKRSIVLLTIFTFLLPFLAAAQETATIKGVIKDVQTGKPLPFASVLVKDTYLGTSAELNGEFVLNNVPVGSNVISASYTGYDSQDITVNLQAGKTTTLEFELNGVGIMGQEVIVTAQVSGQRAAITQQLASNSIINVISAEKMLELPDANAAEAIGRLPGISLKRDAGEANKVVIRGLSPKFNVVTLEGLKLPSTSDFDRSVDLSILPSELLSSIDVTKSLRADMDADALGGTVNLHILAAPSERKIIGVLEGEYADLTNDFANYKVVGGFSDRFFNDKIGVNAKLSLEQKQMPSQQFSGGYSGPAWNFTTNSDGEIIDSTLFVRTQKTSLIDKQQTRKRTNASLILDYKKDWWKVKLLNVYSQKDDFIVTRNNTYVFNPGGNPSNFTLDLNETDWKTGILMHNLMNEFQFGNSKIDLVLATTYAKQTQEDQSFPFVEINNYNLDQNSLIYRQPTSIIDEVGGPGGLNIDDTFLRQLAIGNRELIDRNYDLRLDYEYSFRWKDVISGKFKVGGKYHELVRTSNGTQQSSNFEFGGGVGRQQSLISKFPWIQTDVGAQRGINAANFIDENYNPGPFLNDRFDLGWTADADLLTDIQEGYYTGQVGDPNYFLNGVASFVRDYAANEKLTAGFMMTELNIGKKLMLMPGIRYEKNQTEYAAFQIKTNSGQTGIEPNPEEVTINRENAFWFPSLNLKYALTDAVTIQGASYKSASRPSFRQISPLVIYPTSGNFIQSNNPYLTPAIAWNFDLGASFNTNKSGLITVYAFYKEINDLIFVLNGYQPNKKGSIVGAPADLDDRILGGEYYDEFFLNNNGRTNLPFNNPEKAYVKGLEISWQTNFWYLPGLLKGLVFDVNYTILNTQTKYPFFQSVQTGVDSSGFIPIPIFSQQYNTRKGQMEDQPTSILNVILGWDYKGFSSRISYRFQSQTVEGLDSRYSLFDRFYDSFSLLDLTLKQKITKNISAYVNFKNINRQIDDYFFDEQQENPALPTNSQSYGMRIQFGGRMNF